MQRESCTSRPILDVEIGLRIRTIGICWWTNNVELKRICFSPIFKISTVHYKFNKSNRSNVGFLATAVNNILRQYGIKNNALVVRWVQNVKRFSFFSSTPMADVVETVAYTVRNIHTFTRGLQACLRITLYVAYYRCVFEPFIYSVLITGQLIITARRRRREMVRFIINRL